MPYEINHEKFSQGASLVQTFQAVKETPMPKLNLKIRKSDLRLIDSISSQSGTPRSQILNSMVECIIRKMLLDLAEDDKDCAAFIARRADAASGIDCETKGSWTELVFGRNPNLVGYYFELSGRSRDDFSDQYNTLVDRLEKEKQ